MKLEAIERFHLEKMRKWRNELKDIFREYRPLTEDNQEKWFKSLTSNHNQVMYAITSDEGELVGACGWVGIGWVNKHPGDMSIYIAEEAIGRGEATIKELLRIAFEELNFHTVRAEVFEFNPVAKKLYQELGYKIVGYWRDAHYYKGRYWDSFLMDMTKGDWEKMSIKPPKEVV